MNEPSPVTAEPFDPSDAAAATRYAERLQPRAGAVHLLVILGVAGSDWAVRALFALADALASNSERAVVVADLAFARPALSEPLGLRPDEGLTDVLLYGASVDHVRVRPADRAFDVIPTGFVASQQDELLRHPRWQNLIERIETGGARLLAALPADAAAIGGLLRRTNVVFLGSEESARRWHARWPAAELTLALKPIRTAQKAGAAVPPAVVRGPGPGDRAPAASGAKRGADGGADATAAIGSSTAGGAASTAAGDAAPADPQASDPERPAPPAGAEAVGRAARRHWRRTGVLVLVIVLIVSALAGLWHFGRDSFGEDNGASIAGDAQEAATGQAPAAAPLPAVQPAGEPLPYSVAVEAHDNLPMASRRAASLRTTEPDIGFFIAPILVDSTLYYRVMAGPLASSEQAQATMQALLARGRKTGGSEWDIRSTPYAFLIGEYEQVEQATARMDELKSLEIPSYVVEVPYADGPPKFYLYSGAYAGPAEADVMRRLLRSAGLPDTLVQRIGRSPT